MCQVHFEEKKKTLPCFAGLSPEQDTYCVCNEFILCATVIMAGISDLALVTASWMKCFLNLVAL